MKKMREKWRKMTLMGKDIAKINLKRKKVGTQIEGGNKDERFYKELNEINT